MIASHVNPDGDAIGSVLALGWSLRQLGLQVRLLSHDPVPMNLRFLPGWDIIEVLSPERTPAKEAYQEPPLPKEPGLLGIVADVGVMERLGRSHQLLEAAEKLVVIDHHQPADVPPGDIQIVDPGASATCLILYRLLPEIGVEISPDIAQCLLTGIITDTGGFRYQNTDPESLEAASKLLSLGADMMQINREVWEKKPISAVRLMCTALNHLELYANSQIAISHLSLGDYKEFDATDEDTEGIVNEIGRINTAQIAALFREHKQNRIRVSVRSRGDIDVAAVCRQFGGGGHINAAGCTFESSIEEAKSLLIPALEECLASY